MAQVRTQPPKAKLTPLGRQAMVDLIDGEKLCDLVDELVGEQNVGVRIVRQVVPEFFDQFGSADWRTLGCGPAAGDSRRGPGAP